MVMPMRSQPLLLACLLASSGAAAAQDTAEHTAEPARPRPNEIERDDEPVVDEQDLETPTSDPTPPARGPDADSVSLGVVEQAGVGGTVPYGAAGVLEGGGAGLAWGDDTGFWASLRPFVGLFVADAVEISFSNPLVFTTVGDGDINTALSFVLEPSLHLGLVDRLWFAVGVGGGVIYNGVNAGGLGTARLGLDLLIGRSAIMHLHAVGMLSSEPLALPASTEVGLTQWRIGFEIAYAALF